MTVYTIPLKQDPSQRRAVMLLDQPFVIELRQLKGRQYFSASISGEVICRNVLMVNKSRIMRAAYKNVIGDFFVIDTQGDAAPEYTGWGTRWLLAFSADV